MTVVVALRLSSSPAGSLIATMRTVAPTAVRVPHEGGPVRIGIWPNVGDSCRRRPGVAGVLGGPPGMSADSHLRAGSPPGRGCWNENARNCAGRLFRYMALCSPPWRRLPGGGGIAGGSTTVPWGGRFKPSLLDASEGGLSTVFRPFVAQGLAVGDMIAMEISFISWLRGAAGRVLVRGLL